MFPLSQHWRMAVLAGIIVAGSYCLPANAADPKSKPTVGDTDGIRPPSPIVPRSNVLTAEPWKGVPIAALTAADLDKLVAAELRTDHIQPAARTTDEAFLRRVTLDLTGKLPTPSELAEFVRDKDPSKRAKVIDKLLASDAYAHHWADFWRDVMTARFTDRRQLALVPEFEKWLLKEFRENKSWRDMTRAMLTAEGSVPIGPARPAAMPAGDSGSTTAEPQWNPAAAFLLAHLGDDQAEERAAETSRVFLGIQLQCAQCHDHPFDEWKQKQFHELAAYFSRIRSRQVVGQQNSGRPRIDLMSIPVREHKLPDKADPTKGTIVAPKFLTGVSPPRNLPDLERRTALANEITNPENFWFAAAFVNRTWGELMGQSFGQPVDDLGPGKDVFMPAVLARMSASFRASDYDIKQLIRTICNSEAYQRQIRPGASAEDHLHFAAAYPTRLPGEALWQSLISVLGALGPPLDPRMAVAAAFGANARPLPFEYMFLSEFRFDPSLKADEVEGSIPQALILMNSPQINRAMQARGASALAQLLKQNTKDEDAVRALYYKTLTRKPTDHEMSKAVAYVHKIGKREEAFEDLLWTLINSTEFQTKR
jgi:Protein of unknown function (DUF1549)/Protein of unknown function (DUF1553)